MHPAELEGGRVSEAVELQEHTVTHHPLGEHGLDRE